MFQKSMLGQPFTHEDQSAKNGQDVDGVLNHEFENKE